MHTAARKFPVKMNPVYKAAFLSRLTLIFFIADIR
uniref:Uncharacterized protein n=1 Tax=Anguilla anguilla TaxID=7936 RepID=A0A0E9U4P1_ANGAN